MTASSTWRTKRYDTFENRLAPRMVLIITNHEYRRKLEQTFQN